MIWKLRILKPYLTTFAYAELLRTAREEENLNWLNSHWFFEEEIKCSREGIEKLIREVKREVKISKKTCNSTSI